MPNILKIMGLEQKENADYRIVADRRHKVDIRNYSSYESGNIEREDIKHNNNKRHRDEARDREYNKRGRYNK